jgi:TetR/AcrR family transcriptional regulator, cholesterol catabolism regulator
MLGSTSDASTKDVVLASAAALFAERGYHGTRIKDIAQAAGLSKPAVYHYVRSKEELLFALASETIQHHLVAAEEAASSSDDPVEALTAFIEAHLRGLFSKRASVAFALLEARSLPADQFRSIAELRGQYARKMEQLIRKGRDRGVLRRDVPERELSIALSNVLNGSLLWYRPQGEVEPLGRLVSTVYLHGIGRPGGHDLAAERPAATAEPRFEMPPDLQQELGRSAPARAAAILDVAVRSFRNAGYLGTSTRVLAHGAGLGNATLYHHVEDKEQLLFLICLQALKEQADHAVVARSGGPASDEVRRFIAAHVTALLDHPDRSAVTITEARHLSGLRNEQISDLSDRYRRLFESILTRGQSTGTVRQDIDATTLSHLVLSALNWTALWYRPQGSWKPTDVALMEYEILYRGAANG